MSKCPLLRSFAIYLTSFMELINTSFEGVQVISPTLFKDERGHFFESYQKEKWALGVDFIQDNEAFSTKGVLRGLHYQLPPYAQSKLVRVVKGEVLDVIVDLRPGSATFGKHLSLILSGTNQKQMFVPKGFAHGYIVLSNEAIFAYKCDAYYHKESEAGIKWDDPALGIDWILSNDHIILSQKDKELPLFQDHIPFK